MTAALAHAKHFANKTYLYTFDYRGELSQIDGLTNDTTDPLYNFVHHADDLFYLFPHPFKNHTLNKADSKVAQIFVDLWTSFAIDGVPKSSKTPVWKPITREFICRIKTKSILKQVNLKPNRIHWSLSAHHSRQ